MIKIKNIIQSSLLEGKKQALQYALANSQEDPKSIKRSIEDLTKEDPTSPKNKYIEALTKYWISTNTDIKTFLKILKDDNVKSYLETIEKRKDKIELQKIKTYPEFLDKISELANRRTKSFTKGGIKGLSENKDYIMLKASSKEYPDAIAYIPLNFEASAKISSESTGTCKGFWCTAGSSTNTDTYWEEYTKDKGVILVYIVDYSGDINKWAVAYYAEDIDGLEGEVEIFNYKDHNKPINVFEQETGFDIKEIIKEIDLNYNKIRKHIKLEEPIERFAVWLEDVENDLNKGESFTLHNNTLTIKTNGFLNSYPGSFLEDLLNEDLFKAISGDIYDVFYYDYYKNHSTYDILRIIQDHVHSSSSKKEIEKFYPDFFNIDYTDEDQVQEFEENNDTEELNRALNQAEEQSYMDQAYTELKERAIDALKELFTVKVNNLEDIILSVSVEELFDLSDYPIEYVRDGETVLYYLNQETEISAKDIYGIDPILSPEDLIDDYISQNGINA